MQWLTGAGLKAGLGAIFGSLEKRLIGALLLIVACTGALQVISQDRAIKLRVESETLRAAATNTEHAEQLVKSISQFRLATHLYLSPEPGVDASESDDGELTDTAIRIGEQINALRATGMELYGLTQDNAALNDIDQHVATIIDVHGNPASGRAERAAIDDRNARMAALAAAIEAKASADRDGAYDQLSRSSSNWQWLVIGTGAVTIGFALLILFDLLFNILPALRRMHVALRRLAAGDLDIEVGDFRLRELKALSGSLETFRRNAQAVQNLAFTDPSTGLPNRRAFVDRTGERLAGANGQTFLVMLADIDRFKHVNDDYGHAVGDQLVKLIGERMKHELGPDAIIARVGGDEFALCVALPEAAAAPTLGTNLIGAMRAPFDLGDYNVAVSISLGLVEAKGIEAATGDDEASDREAEVNALINKADLALYASKNGGRNRATRFTTDLAEERELSRALERDLALGLDDGQLRMVYQPIHPFQGAENEVEALVRWNHPLLGEISPSRFIPAAERSGLMVQLGYWIVQRALTDLARWPGLSMSINLSPLQLAQEGFVGFLMDCCRKQGITPQRVILEVTESLSIERNTRALMTLNLLRNAGFRIALDDFGTGYSSLCMMKTFKFDRLKLDRSLITDLDKDPTSQAVFDAAVTMALRIGAEVVAEGISEEDLVSPVRSAGCTHVQGYHYSRPIEADAVQGYYEGSPQLEGKPDAGRKVA
ncbi:bifunctional diguanylate cyclase/phosphodiesterase [Novosphingobium sp. G106]|uniref:putative bifunctional diguanylate cyclase/phosphodiesterase n=1 Tax=Novosphingobium sp. G106 TaxID=2849500 RepID=UPI001C2D01F6|nr:bifunctional diguanylate cyclase/phosphodiesterase [Novosphingobium sp. G106]MBV1689744.1 bifunctional diguanylate cyclase/phosphodiesterase [Novosphingobium sp. G106]